MNLRIMPLDPRKKKLSPSFTLFSFFRVGVKRITSWLTIIMIYTQFVITLLPSQSSFQVSAAFSSSSSNKKELTLYAAGFFPVSTKIPEGAIGRGVLPAVDLALQHINDSPKILPGIHLDLVYNDTECNAALGMKTLFDHLYAPPPKVMLFGDACNSVTDPIAKASRFFHLIQLSYADTHPMYTSESYPNFYRVVPSESAFNPARLAIIKHFNWTRVGTFYQNAPRYSLPHSKLLTDLDKAGIEIAFTQSIADETDPELQKVKERDVRIIVGSFDGEWAGRIFCQAYKHGIFGRKYQWILGSYDDKWWEKTAADPKVDCSLEQLLEAIDGYISIDVLPLSSSRDITVSGMTAYEYEAAYNRLRNKEYSKYHGYAYDGIWTIAFAIHLVDLKLRAQNSPHSFKDFKYRDPQWAKLFKQALNDTTFIGVTGNVTFEDNERKGSILFTQIQGGNPIQIGEYHSTKDRLDLDVGHPIYWRGGNSPPVDRTFRRILPSRISLTLFIVISIFAVCGIVLACIFLAMNIKYRHQKYIKMSSPYLNNLIIIGCILTYTSVILLGLDSSLTSESNFPYICAARAWVLMSGFTLAFGSMFSKTWRVHAIFTNIKLNKKVIKDYKLFMVVGVLVAIDVVTLTTWQIVDPFYRETSLGVAVPSAQNEDILVVPEMEFCQSKRMTIFLGSIYVYKGLLMVFGIFLSWETRHVSIPALNDSKYIGMSVYNVVIMCVIGAGLSFVLRDQQDAAFVIISIFIIFCSTATLCLVFVPKLIELNSNPEAGEKRVRATLKPFKKPHRDSDEVEAQSRIKVLLEENNRRKQKLKEKTYELEALMSTLRGLKQTANGEEVAVAATSSTMLSSMESEITTTIATTYSSSSARKCQDKESQPPNQKPIYIVSPENENTASRSLNTTSIVSLSPSPCPVTIDRGNGIKVSSPLKMEESNLVLSTTQASKTLIPSSTSCHVVSSLPYSSSPSVSNQGNFPTTHHHISSSGSFVEEEERRTSSSSSRQPSISAITSGSLVPRRPSYIYEQQQQSMNQMIPSSSLTLSSHKLTDDGQRGGQQRRSSSLETNSQVIPTSGNLDDDSSYALAIKSSCLSIRKSSVPDGNGHNSVSSHSSSSSSSSSQSGVDDENDRIYLNNNNNVPGQLIQSSTISSSTREGESSSSLTEGGLKCDIVEYL